jgi:hypothetical protein
MGRALQQFKAHDELTAFLDAVTMAAGTTGAIATHDSAAVDLGSADSDEVGELEAVFSCTTDMTSGGSATIAFQVVDCDTSGGTYAAITPVAVAVAAKAFAATEILAAAHPLRIPLPKYGVRRYIKFRYIIATATITGGVVEAWLQKK